MKNLLPVIMAVVFLLVLVFSNIYLTRRVAWVLSFETSWWLHIFFAVVPVLMMTGLLAASNATSAAGSLLYILSAFITGFVLYFLLSMLVTELLHLFLKLSPAQFGWVALVLALLVSGAGTWNAFRVKLSRMDVDISGLEREVSVMQFSDVHLGHFRGTAFLQKLVDMANEEDPDFVVITGDLFDGRKHLNKETLAPLKQFSVPVYFVEGNHDGYSGVKEIKQYLRETGILVLENEIVKEGPLQLVGLNHMRADADAPRMHSIQDGQTIKQVMSEMKLNHESPSILLHHSPDGIEYASAKGIDLYLAGHTHGGQLFPVTYMNDLIFKYNKGLYSYNGTQIYVSKGAGTFGPPMRVGTRSEITHIRLIPVK